MNHWTLTGLYQELQNDLAMCHSQLERDNCLAIGGREIRNLAHEIQRTRKLTPGEQSVLLNI